jgi:hypothetical protein
MNVEIKSDNDEFFNIQTSKFGEAYLATDGERVVINNDEEVAREELKEKQIASSNAKAPIPAPLENPKGLSWFDGTSWGVN